MKKPIHHVTDHALVRYLERVKGMDVEAIRRMIGRKVDRGVKQGASGVISGGMVYKLQGRTVVTIAPHHEPNKRSRQKRRSFK